MAVRVTAAHTAEAPAEAGREAGEGAVAAVAAALAPSGFLGLPAPFSEEGNRADPEGAAGVGAWMARAAGTTDPPRPRHLADLAGPSQPSTRPPGLLRPSRASPAGRPSPPSLRCAPTSARGLLSPQAPCVDIRRRSHRRPWPSGRPPGPSLPPMPESGLRLLWAPSPFT